MNKYKNSIRKRIALLILPILACIISMLICMIYCAKSYNKSVKFYTDSYYKAATFSADLTKFNTQVQNYLRYGGDHYLNQVYSAYDDAKDSFSKLYDIRYDFTNGARYEIENINTRFSNIAVELETVSEKSDNVLSLSDSITSINTHMDKVLDISVENGNAEYKERQLGITIAIAVMIIVFVASVLLSIYLFYVIHKKVTKPIDDIADWSRMFKEDYADMADLKDYEDDEIGELSRSFNLVKQKLVEANQLKKESEKALRKLKEEEEYKKKFVKQLYDEKREKESISAEAKRDGLTGLYNRRSFDALIDDYVAKKPGGKDGALFLIDMDNFKSVNDTLGHLAGDEALKTLAGVMRIVFPGGYLGRYGGDEFIAFAIGVSKEDALSKLGQELCHKMDKNFEYGGKVAKISVSVGIADTVGVDDYSELYMRADKALYYAKEHGRNQYKLASTLQE